jgi:acetyltransferase
MDIPTALASPDEAARAVVAAHAIKPAPVLGCWIGGASAEPGRQILRAAGIPAYNTPLAAVRGFMHLVEYRRGQETLMQTPPSAPEEAPDIATARGIVEAALGEGRRLLTEPESKRLLAAYDIPVVPTEIARSPAAAAAVAARIGFPVALKILSRDITHKSDVGGVALNLETAVAVQLAAETMDARLAAADPRARHDGYVVQPMVRRPGAFELILGAAEDAQFGPILMFGHGGTAAETIADKALALPPLNLALADAAMRRTRIDRLLRGFRDRPPAARGEIARTLVRLSRLVADIEEVAELDINPLLADDKGVIALDARVAIRPAAGGERAARFAIRPYPSELEKRIDHEGEALLLRPIRPEDEPALRETVRRLSPEDIRFRFFGPLRELSHEAAARLTQIDYDR